MTGKTLEDYFRRLSNPNSVVEALLKEIYDQEEEDVSWQEDELRRLNRIAESYEGISKNEAFRLLVEGMSISMAILKRCYKRRKKEFSDLRFAEEDVNSFIFDRFCELHDIKYKGEK